MRAALAGHRPPDAQESSEYALSTRRRPLPCHSGSLARVERDAQQGQRVAFAVLDLVGEHRVRERQNLGERIFAAGPLDHDAGQFGNLGNPPAVRLAVELDGELHRRPF